MLAMLIPIVYLSFYESENGINICDIDKNIL
jgi:hypothetical protein